MEPQLKEEMKQRPEFREKENAEKSDFWMNINYKLENLPTYIVIHKNRHLD
jgi:hypothetical protein